MQEIEECGKQRMKNKRGNKEYINKRQERKERVFI